MSRRNVFLIIGVFLCIALAFGLTLVQRNHNEVTARDIINAEKEAFKIWNSFPEEEQQHWCWAVARFDVEGLNDEFMRGAEQAGYSRLDVEAMYLVIQDHCLTRGE